MHYDYIFFIVTHLSKKNMGMGKYLDSKYTVISMDQASISKQWHIGEKIGKTRRLPHPDLWECVTEDEKDKGFKTVSCIG